MVPGSRVEHTEAFQRLDGISFEVRAWKMDDGSFFGRWSCNACFSLGGDGKESKTVGEAIQDAVASLQAHRCRFSTDEPRGPLPSR